MSEAFNNLLKFFSDTWKSGALGKGFVVFVIGLIVFVGYHSFRMWNWKKDKLYNDTLLALKEEYGLKNQKEIRKELKENSDEIKKVNNDLSKKINRNTNDITGLQKDVEHLQEDIKEIKDNMDTGHEDIKNHITDVFKGLKDEIREAGKKGV